ncbi:DMT family transporter [Sorangium sp. So ce321]|uniref:DMT family transporter n=1 Tax=Sorangium sp. So ce321 TaxID=3133300 RepID=UPI003F613388
MIYLQVVLATLLLSGVFVVGSSTVHRLDPTFVAAARFAIAAVIFPLLLTVSKRWEPASARGFKIISLCSVTGVLLYNVLFFFGLKYSTVTHGSAIIATAPVWTVLLARVFLKEPLTPQKLVGMVVSFLGVLYIVIAGRGGGVSALGWRGTTGDIAFLGAVVVWAAYSILGRKAVAIFSPLVATAYAVMLGAALLCAYALVRVDVPRQIALLDAGSAAGIGYMAAFGTVVAFVLWYRGIQQLGAGRTTIFLNLVPVWSFLLAAVFLGEAVTPALLAALGVVIVGVALVQLPSPRRASREQAA